MLKNYFDASHNWKQNWNTPTGSFFIVVLFNQIVEKWLVLFGPYYIISVYAQDSNFNTLISNLKLNFQ